MPRVEIALTDIVRTGTTPPAEVNGDPTNNHTVVNDGSVFLQARNAGAGAETVTVETPGTVDTHAVGDLTVSIPAGATRLIGPFPETIYNAGRVINVNPQSANIKLIAYRLPR